MSFSMLLQRLENPSPLKSQIEKCMESVDHLDVVQHTHSMKISLEVKSECLAIVTSQIVML